MDWGLIRSKKKGKYGLRDVIQYPPAFYYFAMVINALLRFFWVISFIDLIPGDWKLFHEIEFLIFLSMIAEAIRRTIWALIRIENEFHNNFENYRTILVIPNLIETKKKY